MTEHRDQARDGLDEPGQPILTVAVTGGIGAGKSTVSGHLAQLGAVVIDSDVLAREVVAPGTPGLAAVARAFGPGVIAADGSLDRPALAAVVFADPAARGRLNALTHPLVRTRFAELQAAVPAGSIVVNDIPLLVDLSTAASFHLSIGVGAGVDTRIERLIVRGLAEGDARARIAAQIDDEQRRELCDVWLDNSGPQDDLRVQVNDLWSERLVPFRENLAAGRPATDRSLPAPANSATVARLSARIGRVLHLPLEHDPSDRGVTLVARVSSIGDVQRFEVPLRNAGFPPRDGAPGEFVNADPGQSLNLYLRVSPTD